MVAPKLKGNFTQNEENMGLLKGFASVKMVVAQTQTKYSKAPYARTHTQSPKGHRDRRISTNNPASYKKLVGWPKRRPFLVYIVLRHHSW